MYKRWRDAQLLAISALKLQFYTSLLRHKCAFRWEEERSTFPQSFWDTNPATESKVITAAQKSSGKDREEIVPYFKGEEKEVLDLETRRYNKCYLLHGFLS